MKRIYIASPYSIGNRESNVNRSLKAANVLIGIGYAPFAPLLSHFQNQLYPRAYETWLGLDLEWLVMCDAVLRLSGPSLGADIEEARAKELGIPVYFTVADLVKGCPPNPPPPREWLPSPLFGDGWNL